MGWARSVPHRTLAAPGAAKIDPSWRHLLRVEHPAELLDDSIPPRNGSSGHATVDGFAHEPHVGRYVAGEGRAQYLLHLVVGDSRSEQRAFVLVHDHLGLDLVLE